MVAGGVDIGVAEDDEGALGGAVDQADGRLEDRDAGPLGPGEGAGDVKAIFGEELVEVVAGDAARDIGEALADQVGVAVADRPEPRIDLAAAAPLGDDRLELGLGGGADTHTEPVVGEDLELLDIVRGPAGHDRVDAAGVVADHPAEGAVVVRRRIRPEGQVVLLGGAAEVIEDEAGLDAGGTGVGVEGDEVAEILRHIEDDGDVAALPGEARSAAASEYWGAVVAADPDRGDEVIGVVGDDDADRDLAVVRAIGRVEGSRARVEADLAPDLALEGGGEGFGVDCLGGGGAELGRGARAGGTRGFGGGDGEGEAASTGAGLAIAGRGAGLGDGRPGGGWDLFAWVLGGGHDQAFRFEGVDSSSWSSVLKSLYRIWSGVDRRKNRTDWKAPGRHINPSRNHILFRPREGDRTDESVLGLTRIEASMLYDDRNIRLDQARVVGAVRDRLGVLELVEADKIGRASCRERVMNYECGEC